MVCHVLLETVTVFDPRVFPNEHFRLLLMEVREERGVAVEKWGARISEAPTVCPGASFAPSVRCSEQAGSNLRTPRFPDPALKTGGQRGRFEAA